MSGSEWRFSSLHVFSTWLWTTGLILVILELVVHHIESGKLGILIGMAGAVLNVKAFLLHMEERERNAFELGRDAEPRVRPVT